MALQFVFGGSGSGKTEYLIREAVRKAPEDFSHRFLFLVPEQDTLNMQKRIVSHSENSGKGILNIDVLSFNRLAYHVFQELHLGLPEVVDDTGKIMILRKTAETVKEELLYYGQQLNHPGFLSELKSQISEFYQYRITPEILALLEERSASPVMRNKFHDLKLLLSSFQDYMDSQGYIMQEEILDRLLHYLPESSFLHNSSVFLDGFTGFTPVQLDILEEILLRSGDIRVCLDLRGDETASIYERRGVEDLFYLTRETVRKLTERAEKHRVPVLAPLDLNAYDLESGEKRGEGTLFPRFLAAPALQHLSEEIYRFGEERTGKAEAGEIALWEAADIRMEVAFAAEEIERAVREQGIRYHQVGILLPTPEEYRDVLYQTFHAAGIPYFLDDSRSLLDSPYAEGIRSALEVLERGFGFDSVVRYLRSMPALSEEEEDEIDRFENYLRESGIRGIGRYRSSWEHFEDTKQKLLGPLLAMQDAAGRGSTVAERTEAIRGLLESTGSRARIETEAERLRTRGEQNTAEELMQGVKKTDALLDKLSQLLGDTVVSRREYGDILDSGLKEETFEIIPATMDQVIVGDLKRTRFSSPALFFILGASAGSLPKAKAETKLLGDRERALFSELELELAPTMEEDALLERMYIYRALSAPSRRLIVSYANRGRSGKGQRMSAVMESIQKLFPLVPLRILRQERQKAHTFSALRRRLSMALSEYPTEEEEIVKDFALLYGQETERARAEGLFAAMFTRYRNTKLDKQVAKALYGDMLTGSITRLELYNSCAYAHFLRYGLRLSERKVYEVQAFDIGNIYHQAIEYAFRWTEEKKRNLGELTEEELRELTGEVVQRTAENYRGVNLLEEGRNQYLLHKVLDITETTLWALSEQLKKGDFYTAALEREFDLVRDGVRLKGRIDRVDLCEDGDRLYVKIIDYKSGKTEFSLQKVYAGLQIQLVTYLNVMLTQLGLQHPGKEVVPAGIFYYHIDSPVLPYQEAQSEESQKRERLKTLRVDGLVNTDLSVVQHMDRVIEKESDVIPVVLKDGMVDEKKKSAASTRRFDALRTYVDRRIVQDAKEIMQGDIETSPVRYGQERDACSFCPYHSICGFDERIRGYAYRKFDRFKPEEIWEKLTEEEEKQDGKSVD